MAVAAACLATGYHHSFALVCLLAVTTACCLLATASDEQLQPWLCHETLTGCQQKQCTSEAREM